jgi:signal transduction histidine kinase/ActR/RegA family two-component response regulator
MQRLDKLYIEHPAIRERALGSYAVAAAAAAIATVTRLAIDPYVTGVQYITFFPAVIVTGLLSGLRAGLVCVALSVLAAHFFILHPRWSFAISEWAEVIGLTLFTLIATTMVILIGALRYAIRRYRELSQTLEARVEERSRALLATQERLVHSQKMEVLGQLTAGLAHDFNNMNAVVIGNLDLARRRLSSSDTHLAKFLDYAMAGAKRATELTQRLLSFARRQPLVPAVTDIDKLTLGMSELLTRTLGERVKLECITAEDLWKARIDPNQLESALVNLAVNARDAMPGGGTLTIEAANGYLDENYAAQQDEVAPGQYVVIAVSDTGSGMVPEIAQRAIEPFFTTKEPGLGTGLGLSQVYGFLKQSGGHLAIYSQEGHGTTVRLYVPRALTESMGAEQRAITQEPAPAGSLNETILVVEDESHVRRMSVAALKELGYQVYEASNGEDALKILMRQPEIALLFTDIVMPGMDGWKLAEAARADMPGIQVLYTTGYAVIHEGTHDPDAALIGKPFTNDELARKIRSILDHTQRKPAQATSTL